MVGLRFETGDGLDFEVSLIDEDEDLLVSLVDEDEDLLVAPLGFDFDTPFGRGFDDFDDFVDDEGVDLLD